MESIDKQLTQPKITYDLLIKYKDKNISYPPELQKYVDSIKSIQIKTKTSYGNWKKPSNYKNNWLLEKKLNKNDDEKIESKCKGILNKISDSNFDEMIEELLSLEINTDDQLNILVNQIFKKAVIERNFNHMYAKLCFKLLHIFIVVNNQNRYFRVLFINKCQHMFEAISKVNTEKDLIDSEFKSKEEINGLISFVGELYNHNILNDNIIYGCVLTLLIGIDSNRWSSIEQTCTLIESIKTKFKKSSNKNYKNVMNELTKIQKRTDIQMKDKFILMDILET